ncbi:hypothetical protein NO2_1658, partial [Candidatus Termititenax persephonae]
PRLTKGLSGEAAEAEYQSEKRRLSGLRLDLAEYRRQYEELHGVPPTKIVFRFEQYTAMNNFSLAILKRFKISLYDSTSVELADTLANKSLRDAHTIDVSLDPSQNALPTLAEYGITFDEAAMTVEIDLTQRTISWDNIMRAMDASYIQEYESTAEGGVKFNMRARPASTEDWAFIGVYYNDKFDLPLDSGKTFNYKLSNFIAPDYGHDEKDAGYRVVFSFGKKADGNYRELIFDPNGYSPVESANDGILTVPLTRLHENYLSARFAEVETLGSNNLRLKFDGKDSRVTINDAVERPEDKFKFDIDHDDMSDSARISYLRFKVRKTAGLNNKTDFFSKIKIGLKLEDAADANQDISCPFILNEGRMNYILEENSDVDYYENSAKGQTPPCY